MTPRQLHYGEGSVYRRQSDGRWVGSLEAGWNEHGKRRRVYATAKSEDECRRRLRDKRAAIAAAEGRAAGGNVVRLSVKGWVDEWLPIREETVRPNTYGIDAAAMRWVLPAIGRKRIVDLAPRDVRAVVARMRAGGVEPASVARYFRAMRKMLRDARQEGYQVAANVLEVPGPGEGENDREALETVQAVAVMHHATDLPHGGRYFVAFYQGLRQGEALGLTWPAVDFETNSITVEWQLQALPYKVRRDRTSGFRVPVGYPARHLVGRFHLVPPKSARGQRVIPMVPEVRQVLLDLRAAQAASGAEPHAGDLVWVRENGWPIDKADDTEEFQRLQAAAGVHHPAGRPYKPHEMRNTTAQLLLEAGVDPVVITAILGHANWATSARYTKARMARMREAMEQIAIELRPKAIEA